MIERQRIIGAVVRMRRQHTDDAHYEAKACRGGLSADVWESVSAFANTAGGTLLLGLDERCDFSVAEGFDINRVRDQFVEGIGDGGAQGVKLGNSPIYEMDRIDLDDRQILAIEIAENEVGSKPCFIMARGVEPGSYKRVDDKDIRLSKMEVYEYQNALRPSNADRETVPDADISDLDGVVIDAIIAKRQYSKALLGVNDRLLQMERLNIIDKRGRVRLAGLLVTGQYPQQYYPRLLVDVAVHVDTDKAAPGLPRFLDRVQCEGPLPMVVKEAVSVVLRNLRTKYNVRGVGGSGEPEIPEEVLREGIANAVIHREYHPYFTGQAVSVDVFSNRVVITSPGGLWGGKTLENIMDGTSRCRNEFLMQLMQETPLKASSETTVEGQGTGVALMVREMKAHGLPAPQFEASADQFVVILSRSDSLGTDSFNEHSLSMRRRRDLRLQKILDLIPETGEIGVKAISKQLGVSMETVRRDVRDLLSQGLIVSTAPVNSRNRKYTRLADKPSERD